MPLSHEAIICLRPPSKSNLSVPSDYKSPNAQFLSRHWQPVFTTLPSSRYDRSPPRDPTFHLRFPPASATYTATETWIDPADVPDPLEVEARPRNSTVTGRILVGGGTETGQGPSQFEEDGSGRKWEVISWGKQGQLESWMIDDDSGLISDDSGEARPDWRNFYVVVYYEAAAGEEAGIEVWDSIGRWRRLTSQTFGKIRDAIRGVQDEDFARLAGQLRKLVPDARK